MVGGLVEARLLRIEEGKFCFAVPSNRGQHVGGACEVHVARGVHGDTAASRRRGGRISATKVGGVKHALGTAAAGVDLAGEELGRAAHGARPSR